MQSERQESRRVITEAEFASTAGQFERRKKSIAVVDSQESACLLRLQRQLESSRATAWGPGISAFIGIEEQTAPGVWLVIRVGCTSPAQRVFAETNIIERNGP